MILKYSFLRYKDFVSIFPISPEYSLFNPRISLKILYKIEKKVKKETNLKNKIIMKSLIALSICLILVQTIFHEASAQSALTRRRSFTNRDFVFDLFKSTPTAIGAGGNGKLVDVERLRPLEGLGVSSVIFEIEPCAINLPHVHPRATELFHVLQGSFTTAFLEENTGRVIENQSTVGQVTVFP
jgi:hypothetical protein